MNRRAFLGLSLTVSSGALAGCTVETATESRVTDQIAIDLTPEVTGLTFPTDMAFLPSGDRLITERHGQLVLAHADGETEVILDLSDRMSSVADEKGLVGLAVHPSIDDTNTVYLRYSGAIEGSQLDAGLSHLAVLSAFQFTDDHSDIIPGSERRLLEIPQPGPVHNGGDIAFGPDGYLYVALGDGQRTDLGYDGESWWYEKGQASQNLEDNLRGGILRIDVDTIPDDRPYGIPAENPLVNDAGRDEYYAWGLRNPYRISFDGDELYIADVGEFTRESIYLGHAGANYGWPVTEGSSCSTTTSIHHALEDNPLNLFNPQTWQALTNRVSPYKLCPASDLASGDRHDPVAEYHRYGARAITGGYVYRGDEIPSLVGKYIFGEFVPPAPLYATEAPPSGETPWPLIELVVEGTDHGRSDESIISFARDDQGEVYVLTTTFTEGSVYQITNPDS